MTPTPEQSAIIEAARSTDSNILIPAYAGAAKTSSLVMVAEALPTIEILCLAFNKKIATEMDQRLPPNCTAMTLNSIGHRTWSDAIGRRLIINTSKTYDILQPLIKAHSAAEQELLWDNFAELLRLVDFGKACGYVPTDHYPRAKRLMDDFDFFSHIEQKLTTIEEDLIRDASLRSIEMAMKGDCDYGDQILMPTVFHGAFPRYKLTLVDEAQDLSALNHMTLRKIVGQRRLIAVGDPNQAIYGFRGAHQESMDLLRQTFDMTTMPLTVSFRCPQRVVEHVRWKVPDMKWRDGADLGSVTSLTDWSAEDLAEDAAVICRNNAPLFNIAIKLLKNGRSCELGGKDVVTSLTKIMRKFGGHDLRQAEVMDKIEVWLAKELEKNRLVAHGKIEDMAACMRLFASQGRDLGEALAYAQHLMAMHSPLKLMTGHAAKGLEFDTVYFLDEGLIGREQQEPNLRYVICTRARENLVYIESENFIDQAAELERTV